jgi:hypothetical protein
MCSLLLLLVLFFLLALYVSHMVWTPAVCVECEKRAKTANMWSGMVHHSTLSQSDEDIAD